MEPQFEVVAEGLGFPEGPVVMPDGSVIVVEMMGARVTRCWAGGRKEVVAEPGGGPNGAQLGPDGAIYVCNNGGGWSGNYDGGRIERLDLTTGKVERIYERCGEHGLGAPNDLVFDETGGLWFTDFGRTEERRSGKSGLYWCRPDGSEIREAHFGGMSYNGVGLSPDGRTVYVAATFSGRLFSFALEAPGKLAPGVGRWGSPETLVAGPGGEVYFDSLAVTASGTVCVAALFGGIASITPGGDTTFFPMPDGAVTNIAFGGPDLRDAYITFSESGRLVKMRWPEPGLKLNYGA
jgi:gluconolactonase